MTVDAGAAREMTAGLRAALGDAARQAVAVLAARVRQAHEHRVWLALGYRSWQEYTAAELGVSRAQAYRLVAMARTADAIAAAVTAALPGSPVGNIADLGLSGRALRDVGGRVDGVTELIAVRLSAAAAAGPVTDVLAREIVAATVEHARRPAPALPTVFRPAWCPGRSGRRGRSATNWCACITASAASCWNSRRRTSATSRTDGLAGFCDQIGFPVVDALACRRFVLTGDRRALDSVL